MVDSIGPLSAQYKSVGSEASQSNSSEDVLNDPDAFRLMLEQMTNSNINTLMSSYSSSDEQNNSSEFGGLDNAITALSNTGAGDPLSALMGSSNGNSIGGIDLSLFSPTMGMGQVEANQTMAKLSYLSDVGETLKWLDVVVSYIDPATQLAKEGKIKQVQVENVAEPYFILENGDKVNLSEVKPVFKSDLSADTNTKKDSEGSEA